MDSIEACVSALVKSKRRKSEARNDRMTKARNSYGGAWPTVAASARKGGSSPTLPGLRRGGGAGPRASPNGAASGAGVPSEKGQPRGVAPTVVFCMLSSPRYIRAAPRALSGAGLPQASAQGPSPLLRGPLGEVLLGRRPSVAIILTSRYPAYKDRLPGSNRGLMLVL